MSFNLTHGRSRYASRVPVLRKSFDLLSVRGRALQPLGNCNAFESGYVQEVRVHTFQVCLLLLWRGIAFRGGGVSTLLEVVGLEIICVRVLKVELDVEEPA